MSFLTEYFDEFRQYPIRKNKMCRPENRWPKLEGTWLDPKVGAEDKAWTDEEIEEFIKRTMKSLRGQSTYYNDYCAHLPPEMKTRKFKPRVKNKVCGPVEPSEQAEEAPAPPDAKLAMKDTELMKVAKELYERDMDKPTLRPLPTHYRILGYVRPCQFKTGISEYQLGQHSPRGVRADTRRPHPAVRGRQRLPAAVGPAARGYQAARTRRSSLRWGEIVLITIIS